MKKILLLFLLMVSGMQPARASDLIDMINTFQADKNALERMYTVEESTEYYERLGSFYLESRKKLNGINFEELSRDSKIDYLLLQNLIEKEDYFLQREFKTFQEVTQVTDFAGSIYEFIRDRRRGKRPDAEALAKDFSEGVKEMSSRMEVLKKSPFNDWMQADKAGRVVGSLAEALEEAYKFYFEYDPDFTWWMEKPYAEFSAQLSTYEEFLKTNYPEDSIKDDGSGIIGKPIGREAINESLELEFIPYTPEELIEAAERQFEWSKNEMIKAAGELGYGKDWKAALEHVKNTYVPPGVQPQAINDLFDHSVNFIEDKDLITLPELSKETWQMIMMTPERQKVNPFFTGGWQISISYPTQDMEHQDKMMSMRGNNPNFSFPTVQHELLPGHNLQFYMNSRYKSYRRAFSTPFWMEGWALYWEIILWNKEFAETPEQKLGMLFWRIHRCARIIFSLKYHLGEMTPQQAIDMLVNEVGHEYANAEAEVRRSFATNYSPLYQLAYMTGGLQFFALRNEMLAKGWSEKQFHDRVMQENRMPVEVLRLLLNEEPIQKDYKTHWKFSTEFN